MNRLIDSVDFGRLAIYVWVGFTTLYFLVTLIVPVVIEKAQTNALQSAYGNGQLNGYNTAFVQLGQALGKQVADGCKNAIPLNVGGTGALGVVSTACLQAQQGPVQPTETPTPEGSSAR
jgi:hypothetical protein